MLVFISALQYCLQKNLLIFIPSFIRMVKADLLLYQVTNVKFIKGEKIFLLHLCFGSEQWGSFELNSMVIPTCWILVWFTEWFHYTWTKFFQVKTELCSRCAPNVLQLLQGTQCPETINPVDIFKSHGSWGLSLQWTRLKTVQNNPIPKAQLVLIVQHQHRLLWFALCFYCT